jgi:hypothetical protein
MLWQPIPIQFPDPGGLDFAALKFCRKMHARIVYQIFVSETVNRISGLGLRRMS